MKTAIWWILFLYREGFPIHLTFSLVYFLLFLFYFSSLILFVIFFVNSDFAFVFIGFCVCEFGIRNVLYSFLCSRVRGNNRIFSNLIRTRI